MSRSRKSQHEELKFLAMQSEKQTVKCQPEELPDRMPIP